jgi:hypothetical protein
MNWTTSTFGRGAPFGRTITVPNRPRSVLSVWFGPWSW